ncbi:MAG: PKD domain-containing protein, partial [Deltaproteobacteria bacterium]|nr:PKD domain-containing protein [Deltaproteobacteria bacterium]
LHTDSLTPSHTYRDNGIFTVTLTVTDDDGSVGSDSLTVTVKNIAPTIEAGSDREVNEGDTMGLVSVTFTDPGVDDTHTATIDWKDGSPVETGVASAGKVAGTHIYTDNGQFTPEICVTDDDGGLACDSFVVTVNNVAPTVHAGRDQLTEEGTTVAFSGSFTDPGADTHSYSWHFGDGSPAVTGSLAPVHTYIDNGTYTVTLTVTDDDGGSATDTAMVTVRNLPPVISVLASATVDEGTPLELELTASDNCRLDVVTLEASGLPDGARFSSTPGNPATGTLHWTPAFTQSGSYPGLTFTATDNDGGIDTRTINLIVNEKGQPVLAVTNLVDDTVTLIDQQLNGVVQTVKVGHHPVAAAFHNVWADDSNILAKLYVAERNADALSVLEPASNT